MWRRLMPQSSASASMLTPFFSARFRTRSTNPRWVSSCFRPSGRILADASRRQLPLTYMSGTLASMDRRAAISCVLLAACFADSGTGTSSGSEATSDASATTAGESTGTSTTSGASNSASPTDSGNGSSATGASTEGRYGPDAGSLYAHCYDDEDCEWFCERLDPPSAPGFGVCTSACTSDEDCRVRWAPEWDNDVSCNEFTKRCWMGCAAQLGCPLTMTCVGDGVCYWPDP